MVSEHHAPISTALQDLLFERMPMGVVMLDEELRVLRFNPQWAEYGMRHFVRDQKVMRPGVKIFDLMPDLEEQARPLYEQALRGQVVRKTSLPMRQEEKTTYWDTVLLPLEEEGEIRGVLQVVTDRTDDVRTQQDLSKTLESLRERDERFNLVINGTNDGVWDWNLVTDEIYFSPRWKAMVGFRDDELPNRLESWLKRVHPDDMNAAMQSIQAHLDGKSDILNFEHRVLHRDGKYRWFLTRGISARDLSGRAYRMAGSDTDITEQKEALLKLRRSEEDLRSLMENATNFAIFRVKTDVDRPQSRKIVLVSPSVTEIIGTDEPYNYAAWFKNLHPDDLERMKQANQKTWEKGQCFDQIVRIFNPTKNAWKWIHLLLTPVFNAAGQATHYNGLVMDITEQKEVEEKLRFQSQFEALLTDISTHFINLPSNKVDEGIQTGLGLLARLLGVERGYVFQYLDEGHTMSNTHEWVSEGTESLKADLQDFSIDALNWSNQILLNGMVLNVPDVEAMPEEARLERELFEQQGVKSVISIPLSYQGQVIGFLGFDAIRETKSWSDFEIRMLRVVGEVFINALEHQKAQQVREGQNRFMELLATEGSFTETLTALVSIVEEQMPGMLGLVLLLDENGHHLHVGAGPSLPLAYLDFTEGLEIGPQVGSCGTAAFRKERVLVSDIATDARWHALRGQALKHGLRACWSEPVMGADGRLLGTFAMYYRFPRMPREAELHTMEVAAHLAGMAIEQKRKQEDLQTAFQTLERRVEERTREIETRRRVAESLRDIIAVINSNRTLDETLDFIVEKADSLLDTSVVAVYLLEPGSEKLHLQASRGMHTDILENMQVSVGYGTIGRAVGEKRAVFFSDIDQIKVFSNPEVSLGEHDVRIRDDQWDLLELFKSRYKAILAVPLIVKDNAMGGLAMYYPTPHYFSDEDINLAITFADQAALAIENARLYEVEQQRQLELQDLYADARRRAEEMQTLNTVQQAITSRLDPDSVLHMIADAARRLTNTTMSTVFLVDGDDLVLSVLSGKVDKSLIGYRMPIKTSVGGLALQMGESILITDSETDMRVFTEVTRMAGVRSFLVVPLLAENKQIATITVANDEPGGLRPEYELLLTMLATGAVIALENAHYYREERERRQEAERRRVVAEGLREILSVLNSSRSLEEILNFITIQSCELLGASSTLIRRKQDQSSEFVLDASFNLLPEIAHLAISPILFEDGLALQQRKPVVIPDIKAVYHKLALKNLAPEQAHAINLLLKTYSSVLVVPLYIKDALFGSLTFFYAQPREFNEEDTRLAMTLGDHTALAVENASLRSEAQRSAQNAERRRRVAEGLNVIVRTLNSSRSQDEVLSLIVNQARDLLGANATMLRRGDFKQQMVMTLASSGLPDEFDVIEMTPLIYTPKDQVLISQKPLVIEDIAAAFGPDLANPDLNDIHRQWYQLKIKYFKSYLVIPIVLREPDLPEAKGFGNLTFYFTERQEFTEETIQLARMLADQAALALENAHLRQQSEQSAVIAERNRLARDLHDAVTQTLFSASLIAEVLPRIWDRNMDEGKRRLEELRQLTRGALAEMRTLLMELRPTALLEAEIEELFRQLSEAFMGRSRVPVKLTLEKNCTMPPDVRVAMYRIAQEALNNIAKHAHAEQVELSLFCLPGQVKLIVKDDGRGFDMGNVSSDHLGVGIMKERAEAIGARLTISSEINRGTRIEAVWSGNQSEGD
ncbi:MAG: GAF domain-containing protein [Chloroflexi bacterium]|nr:GAF domain-containing protein [Chloroflexota bacterium]